jgi:nitrogen fixation protein NifQ
MSSSDIYQNLMRAAAGGSCNAFDAHVAASVFVLGWHEADGSQSVFLEQLGLSGQEVVQLVAYVFPELEKSFSSLEGMSLTGSLDEAEICLRQLLTTRAEGGDLSPLFAKIVARRAQRPHHLWQDLGLRNRRELGWLMQRHFPSLAEKNSADMKWKKFLYRVICKDDSFSLCVAPSCEECSDYEGCFGEEVGNPLLALRTA